MLTKDEKQVLWGMAALGMGCLLLRKRQQRNAAIKKDFMRPWSNRDDDGEEYVIVGELEDEVLEALGESVRDVRIKQQWGYDLRISKKGLDFRMRDLDYSEQEEFFWEDMCTFPHLIVDGGNGALWLIQAYDESFDLLGRPYGPSAHAMRIEKREDETTHEPIWEITDFDTRYNLNRGSEVLWRNPAVYGDDPKRKKKKKG